MLDATLRQRAFLNPLDSQNQLIKSQLTDREINILKLVAQGFTNKAIAMKFSISDRTVQNHLANIFFKLNAESRTEAVMRAVAAGLIPPDIGNQS